MRYTKLAATSASLVTVLLGQVMIARAEQPQPKTAARNALAVCRAADEDSGEARAARLSHGLRLAEEAVQADPNDAAAHFAVFCNLGKRMQLRKSSGGLSSVLVDLPRARREIDTALELEPSYAAALAAKGQMLVELPRLMGGDRDEGTRLLRRAVELDPNDAQARLLLANNLEAEGRREEALDQATAASTILEREGPAKDTSLARNLIARLR